MLFTDKRRLTRGSLEQDWPTLWTVLLYVFACVCVCKMGISKQHKYSTVENLCFYPFKMYAFFVIHSRPFRHDELLTPKGVCLELRVRCEICFSLHVNVKGHNPFQDVPLGRISFDCPITTQMQHNAIGNGIMMMGIIGFTASAGAKFQ